MEELGEQLVFVHFCYTIADAINGVCLTENFQCFPQSLSRFVCVGEGSVVSVKCLEFSQPQTDEPILFQISLSVVVVQEHRRCDKVMCNVCNILLLQFYQH